MENYYHIRHARKICGLNQKSAGNALKGDYVKQQRQYS